jgi:CubicO group peptidase (beta-lactamase class C family)
MEQWFTHLMQSMKRSFAMRPRAVVAGLLVATALLGAVCGGDDVTTTTTTATAPSTSATASTTPSTSGSATTSTSSRPATSAAAAPEPAWRYPGADWERVDPAAAGFDPEALDRLASTAEAADSACTVVTRNGAVVDERYWDGATPDTTRQAWSVTKSVTSALVGIAQDHGHLSIADPAAAFIPEWLDTPAAAVSIENLLSNDSGRHWDMTTDYKEMAATAADKTAFAIGLAQDAAPGTVWAYNNSAVQTLSAVLESATGQAVNEYAEEMLFAPIGMDHTSMATDRAGNTTTFAGMESTCLDLARFGYLMLRDGSWNGEQIVSAEYSRTSTRQSSTDLNAAYGYLWWTNQQGPIVSPTIAASATEGPTIANGELLPGAPADIFWAIGFQQQMVAVIPSEGIVAVRMGAKPPDGVAFAQAEFTQAVLDAVVGADGTGS